MPANTTMETPISRKASEALAISAPEFICLPTLFSILATKKETNTDIMLIITGKVGNAWLVESTKNFLYPSITFSMPANVIKTPIKRVINVSALYRP